MVKIKIYDRSLKVFLFFSLAFGLIYTFLIPPFQAPDEVHHFFRAYHISDGHLMGIKTEDQRYGGELPLSLAAIAKPFRPLRYQIDRKVSMDTIRALRIIPLQPDAKVFMDFPNVAYYVPFGYLPQSLSILIGKILGMKPLMLFYFARLANLFSWILLIAIAIYNMPFQKNTVTFLALLPASLFFHAGINPDAITNGLVFLYVAFILKLAFSDEELKKGHVFLLLISLIITLNKVVYAPIILLACLIPAGKFKSRRQYYLVNGTNFLIHLILIYCWYNIAGNLFMTYDQYNPAYREDKQLNPGVDPIAQLHFILEHPFSFLEILYKSYVEIFPWTLKHYVGKFGWEANYLPEWYLQFLIYALLPVAIIENNRQVRTNWKYPVILLLTAIIMTLAFSIVIYMQWNVPGHPQISALSGRYFFSILPIAILTVKNPLFKWSNKFHLIIVFIIILIANVLGIDEALKRYFF